MTVTYELGDKQYHIDSDGVPREGETVVINNEIVAEVESVEWKVTTQYQSASALVILADKEINAHE